ncbi:Prostaglandin G/H synthase 1 [Branchiostoma belcheri]|nr:Prostaglandin G/H synthase 1 [Branchiostoma belcheri]
MDVEEPSLEGMETFLNADNTDEAMGESERGLEIMLKSSSSWRGSQASKSARKYALLSCQDFRDDLLKTFVVHVTDDPGTHQKNFCTKCRAKLRKLRCYGKEQPVTWEKHRISMCHREEHGWTPKQTVMNPHSQHRPIALRVNAVNATLPRTVPFLRRFNLQKADWEEFCIPFVVPSHHCGKSCWELHTPVDAQYYSSTLVSFPACCFDCGTVGNLLITGPRGSAQDITNIPAAPSAPQQHGFDQGRSDQNLITEWQWQNDYEWQNYGNWETGKTQRGNRNLRCTKCNKRGHEEDRCYQDIVDNNRRKFETNREEIEEAQLPDVLRMDVGLRAEDMGKAMQDRDYWSAMVVRVAEEDWHPT